MSTSPCTSRKGTLHGASPEVSYHTPVSQTNTSSGQSLNASSPPTPRSDENSALKSHVAELERAKSSLIQQVADAEARTVLANTRATEAEKHAAAAKLKTKAAIQRAQNRYTERLHANNESRKLREAIEAQDIRHRGYQVSVKSALGNQKARIEQLENEKMLGDWTKERDARINILEEQLDEMQSGFLSSQEEKITNKAQSDKLIQDLQAVIIRLQSSLTEEQEKIRTAQDDLQTQISSAEAEAIRATTVNLESKIREREVGFKAREQELMQHTQVKLREAESHWSQKVEILGNKVIILENQLKDAKEQIELRGHQLQMAARAMQNSPQEFGIHEHQQFSPRQALNSNKQRRVDSTSAANCSTYPLASDHAVMTPRLLKDFEGDISMSNAQSSSRHSTTTTPKRGYGQYVSLQSNRSAGPTAPLQQFPYQQIQNQQTQQQSAGFDISPSRQSGVSPQNSRSIGLQQALDYLSPQQRQSFLQCMNSGNTENHLNNQAHIQGLIQNAQPLQPVFNMGVAQQSHNPMAHTPSNTPTPTRTQYNNGGRSTPTINRTEMIPSSDVNSFMGNWDMSAPVNSQDYAANGWISSEDPRAANFHGSLQDGNTMLQMIGNQSNANENQDHQQLNLNHETRVSSRSTPAPQGPSTRRNPASAEPGKLSCVNCYQHWWENQCDGGQPCSNCNAEGKLCMRQRCYNFATGACDKGSKCPCVHEGDERYQDDDFLLNQGKAGKRPQRIGKKTDAVLAPILRQRI